MNTKQTTALIIIIITMQACVTQRRCFEKFPQPPPSTSVITETKIITRDTTIIIRLPADTVRHSDTVRVGASGLVNYPRQRLDTKFAWSQVWIENSRLRHELYQKESEIAETIKDAISKAETVKETIIREPYPVPLELSWWKQTLIRFGWAMIVLLIIAAGYVVLKKYLFR